MDDQVIENHASYVQRLDFYRSFGYDLEGEREFILDKSMPVSGKILEIGTGKGHFAIALAKRGFSFTSIDISAQEQEIAKLNLRYLGLDTKAKFLVEDAERLSFPNSSFDTIFSVNVFHHLSRPEAVLNEIKRLLKPGGKAVLSDFNERGLEIINACHSHEGKKHDHSRHGLNEAEDYFIKNGFMVEVSSSQAQKVIVASRKQRNPL